MQSKKKTLIALIVLVVLAAAAALVWFFFNPAREANTSDKTVVISVTHGDGSVKKFTVKTDEKFLRGALEQEKLVEGDDGEYGLFIRSVDGETADEANQEWWCVADAEGEMLPTGVEETAINDGDTYEIILKTGW